MKIAVINGTMRRGSTWHCMDLIRQELSKYGENQVTEFSLPRDMPHFCCGCFSCFMNGEDTCPHASFSKPIVDAITQADLVILTSPVYGLDVSGPMKALIDHLCYMWMSHRPNPNMFHTVGLTISTTAGAGLGHATKTLRNSLTFWGAKKTFSFKVRASAMKWSDVSPEKQEKLRKEAAALAAQITRSVKKARRRPNPLFRSAMFHAMAGMQKKNDWNKTDRDHWMAQGWLSGKKPY